MWYGKQWKLHNFALYKFREVDNDGLKYYNNNCTLKARWTFPTLLRTRWAIHMLFGFIVQSCWNMKVWAKLYMILQWFYKVRTKFSNVQMFKFSAIQRSCYFGPFYLAYLRNVK